MHVSAAPLAQAPAVAKGYDVTELVPTVPPLPDGATPRTLVSRQVNIDVCQPPIQLASLHLRMILYVRSQAILSYVVVGMGWLLPKTSAQAAAFPVTLACSRCRRACVIWPVFHVCSCKFVCMYVACALAGHLQSKECVGTV